MIGIPMGTYYQISDSWHAYTKNWEKYGGTDSAVMMEDPYHDSVSCRSVSMIGNPSTFDEELQHWMDSPETALNFDNTFFESVAEPLRVAWELYKQEDIESAIDVLKDGTSVGVDWFVAGTQWLTRVQNKRAAKARA